MYRRIAKTLNHYPTSQKLISNIILSVIIACFTFAMTLPWTQNLLELMTQKESEFAVVIDNIILWHNVGLNTLLFITLISGIALCVWSALANSKKLPMINWISFGFTVISIFTWMLIVFFKLQSSATALELPKMMSEHFLIRPFMSLNAVLIVFHTGVQLITAWRLPTRLHPIPLCYSMLVFTLLSFPYTIWAFSFLLALLKDYSH